MQLHPPKEGMEFMCFIDDVDVGIDVRFCATRQEAEDYAKEQYGDYPDTTEPGGMEYLDLEKERPNAKIFICQIVSRTVL
jgi:hypothetical protein